MSEPTLALTDADLRAETGAFLGYGMGDVPPYTDTAWDSFKQSRIDSCVRSGLRRFYYPEPVHPDVTSYDWSFLRPLATITFPLGQAGVDLPDDFGGFEGEITVVSSTAQVLYPVDLVGEGKIRQAFAVTPEITGRPLMAALRPVKGTSATGGQRTQMVLYPTPDADYDLSFTYYVNPDYISASFPYHLGGAQHAETILESCLAVAEERLDDSAGVHREAFKVRLAASIAKDRQNKPQVYGYNADRSDFRHRAGRLDPHWTPNVRVNGVQY